MKLNIGCGNKKKPGWVNVDASPECAPDLIHDLRAALPYEDMSVEEIVAEDVLEHFDKYFRYLAMFDWARVLKVGGRITIRVPNFLKTLKKFRKFGFDNFVDHIFGETLWEAKTYIGHFGIHKFAYSEESLERFLNEFKIKKESLSTDGLNMSFVGIKTNHMSLNDLKNIEIYSHNNAFINKPRISAFDVKEKIEHSSI